MAREKPPVWGDRLIKDTVPYQSRTAFSGRERGPSPFKQKTLPAISNRDPWAEMESVTLSEDHLTRNRIVTGDRTEPAQAAFDVLRTQLLSTLKDRGWSRVAITSPTKGCGKTFVAANLALSLARRQGSRTILMDLDLRQPSLANTLGVFYPNSMRSFLSGEIGLRNFMLKIGRNLAIGVNGQDEPEAADLLQQPSTHETLAMMQQELDPEVVLYDLPPALYHDDVLSFLPQVDGVLLVIGGGVTKANEVRQTEKLMGDHAPLLGVILNRDEGYSAKFVDY